MTEPIINNNNKGGDVMGKSSFHYEEALRILYLHQQKFIENRDTSTILTIMNAIINDEPLRMGPISKLTSVDEMATLIMSYLKEPETVRADIIKVIAGRRIPKEGRSERVAS